MTEFEKGYKAGLSASLRSYSEKRSAYLRCLNGMDNFLSSHSDDIKFFRMNNLKGVHEIILSLERNVDKFIELDGDAEIPVPGTDEKKRKIIERKRKSATGLE